MCVLSANTAPGRKRAKGPTLLPFPTEQLSKILIGKITTSSAIFESLMTQFAAMETLLPMVTSPSNTVFISIKISWPCAISPLISILVGSAKVMPSIISLFACSC